MSVEFFGTADYKNSTELAIMPVEFYHVICTVFSCPSSFFMSVEFFSEIKCRKHYNRIGNNACRVFSYLSSFFRNKTFKSTLMCEGVLLASLLTKVQYFILVEYVEYVEFVECVEF